MKLRKLLKIGATIALGSVLVSGCKANDNGKNGTSGDEKVTYTLCAMSSTGDHPAFKYAIDKVKEKYPNVEFEMEDFPQDGGQALKTRAATGDLPDILWLNSGLIEPLSKSDSLLQLDEYIKETNYAEKLNKPAQENSMVSSDGHNYVFSVDGVAPIIWYYNKAIFSEHNIKVPENYEELLNATQALKDADIIPMALFGKEPWPLGAFFDAFTVKGNPAGSLALSEGKAKASDTTYKDAIEKMHELIDSGFFQNGVTTADADTAFALFTSEKAAMFQNGIWGIPDVTEALGEKAGYFKTYPTADKGNDKNMTAFTGGGDTVGYGLSKNVKDPDLAAAVAELLAISQAEYSYTELGNVASTINFEDVELKQPLPKMSQEVVEQIESMTFDSAMLQNFPNAKFSTGFAEEMQKFLVGESTADFIKNLDTLIEKTTK